MEINEKIKIYPGPLLSRDIKKELEDRKEVSDLIITRGAFDVVLYAEHAPNYIEEEG